MKQLLHIFIGVILFGLSACQRETTYPLAMQQAESLMNTCPDSALYLLQNMEDSVSTLPKETQIYYHLLTIQAKDKQYITHTSDSLINSIVSFYEDYHDNDRLMLAYYYQGSVYRDMNDAPRALKAFQQVVDLNIPDNDLLAKTYNQMGSLFMYQGLYDEVIRVNRKAIELYLSSGKEDKISYALRDIARMYDVKEQKDSALFYYKEAYNTAWANGDSLKFYDIQGELGGFYYKINEIALAKSIFQSLGSKTKKINGSHIYPFIAYIYKKENMADSAYYYFQKTLKEGNIMQRYNTYYELAQLEASRNKYPQAMDYLRRHAQLKDSIDKITQTEIIARINSLYNYQHTENEISKLKLKESQKGNLILLLLLSLFIIFAISIVLINYQKKKSRQAMAQVKKLKEIEKNNHNKSMAIIHANNQKIAALDILLKDVQEKSNQLKSELILAQKEILTLHNKVIVANNNEQELQIAIFQQSSVYLQLQRAALSEKVCFTEYDWEQLTPYIDLIYPELTKHLYELCPKLSTIELRICWLTKLSFSPTDISKILLRTKSAITMSRIRLYKKIHHMDGTSEMFDEFIKKL
mgnify:FL=1